jgi:hypothetical protein
MNEEGLKTRKEKNGGREEAWGREGRRRYGRKETIGERKNEKRPRG